MAKRQASGDELLMRGVRAAFASITRGIRPPIRRGTSHQGAMVRAIVRQPGELWPLGSG
jgi:hypothetical protein